MVLGRRYARGPADLVLYLQADLFGLLRSAAVACESEERSGRSHFIDRALRFVTGWRIRGYSSTFWRRTCTLKFSKYRSASARGGSRRSNYRDDHRALSQYCVRPRPRAGVFLCVLTLRSTTSKGTCPRHLAAIGVRRMGLRLVVRPLVRSTLPMGYAKKQQ